MISYYAFNVNKIVNSTHVNYAKKLDINTCPDIITSTA